MKTYLLYVRKYNIFANDYVLYVYKVTTDNIYRIIGKIVCTSMEHIKRIDFNEWTQEREDFWKERVNEIYLYREPKLNNDLYPLDYINRLEADNKTLAELEDKLKSGKLIELPFIIRVSNQYAVIVNRSKDGKLYKTHTFPIHIAEAHLKELQEKGQ